MEKPDQTVRQFNLAHQRIHCGCAVDGGGCYWRACDYWCVECTLHIHLPGVAVGFVYGWMGDVNGWTGEWGRHSVNAVRPPIHKLIYCHPSNRGCTHTPTNLSGIDIGIICHPLYHHQSSRSVDSQAQRSGQQLTWHQPSPLLHNVNQYSIIYITQQQQTYHMCVVFPPLECEGFA